MRKRKAISRIFAALMAALILMGGLSVPAYAGGGEETPSDDSGVVTEPQLLTPEGNMSLVDDIQGDAAKDKQFIVVQSRGGAYFYIVIDNAAEGENRVHFLNQVDEADLLSIIEEDSGVLQKTPEPEPMPEVKEPETAKTEKDATKDDTSPLFGVLLLLLLAALGGGGAFFYLKFVKPKQKVKGATDLDEFDLDEWDEEEPDDTIDNAGNEDDADTDGDDEPGDAL